MIPKKVILELVATSAPRGHKRKPWVYFIQREDDGPIKIGTAADLFERLSGLSAGDWRPIRLLGAIPGGRAKEQALHARFRPFGVGGEWFNDCVYIRRRIQAMCRKHGFWRDRLIPEDRAAYQTGAYTVTGRSRAA